MKTILVDAINGIINEDGSIFEEMLELLESYPNQKIILTGANDEQFKKFGLDKAPYKIFTLKHDPEKTDPKYYQMMLQNFDLTSDVVIYFEHNAEAVKSAEAVGIKTMFYDHQKKDLAALKYFLDQNL